MNKYLLMSTAAAALIVANLPSGATAATFQGKNIPFRASAVVGYKGDGALQANRAGR